MIPNLRFYFLPTNTPHPSLRCEEDVEVRREAARLVFALSLNELNKLDIASVAKGSRAVQGAASAGSAVAITEEITTDLVALARSGDSPCSRSAVGALANLSENDATHERILSWGAEFLSKLAIDDLKEQPDWEVEMRVDDGTLAEGQQENADGTAVPQDGSERTDWGLVREVTRCLSNLSGNYAMHEKLLEGGAVGALVRSLKREDATTARFAALGLANLSGQVSIRREAGGRCDRMLLNLGLLFPRHICIKFAFSVLFCSGVRDQRTSRL